MPRLPIPGSDDGVWGGILNEYLQHEHNDDGTHKTIAVSKGGTGATNASAARTNLAAASTDHNHDSDYEAAGAVATHTGDTSAAHAATAVSFAPAGSIAATTVQAAIEEVAAESGASITLSDATPAASTDTGSAGVASTVSRGDHAHPNTGLATDAELTAHASDTTSVHGITDTSVLETTTGSQAKVDTHSSDTTSVHGITDTSALETTSGAQAKVDAHAGATDPHTTYLNTTRHDAHDHSTAFGTAVLSDLSNVAITAPTDGQVLTFDTTNGWQPETIPAGVTDHGALTGLADDDHSIYALADGTRGDFAATAHDHDAAYVNEADHTKAAHDALALDHGLLTGIGDDDHTIYPKIVNTDSDPGRTIYVGAVAPGGTPASGDVWIDLN